MDLDYLEIPSDEEDHDNFLKECWDYIDFSFNTTVRPATELHFNSVKQHTSILKQKQTQVENLAKAAAADVVKAEKLKCDLEKKIELEAEQQRHNYRELIVAKQIQIDQDKEKLAQLKKQLDEGYEHFNIKKEQAKDQTQALKTVNKMYSSNLCMNMDIDETTRVITLIFEIPDLSNKYVAYKVDIKETKPDEYVAVNPSNDIKIYADELVKTKNTPRFLYQVREHAISQIRH